MPPTNAELAQTAEQLAQRLTELETRPAPEPDPIDVASESYASPATAGGVGSLVEYDTLDPLLETPISGIGIVVDRNDDGVLVAPLQVQALRLQDDELGEPGARAKAAEAKAQAEA